MGEGGDLGSGASDSPLLPVGLRAPARRRRPREPRSRRARSGPGGRAPRRRVAVRRARHAGRRLGVDGQRLRGLSRLRRPPLSRVLGGLLRRRLQGAARGLVGDARAGGEADVPQLGPAAAQADLLRSEAGMGRLTADPIRIDCHLGRGAPRSLADDVLDGLTRPFKELPPKHLYDARGSELFDAICELPEYYPTRTERAILEAQADAIVGVTGAAELVELGSGSASKTRVLLDAMEAAGTLRRYVPFDVSEGVVRDCAVALADEYPQLRLHGIVGDFERHLPQIPAPEPGRPRIVAFLGGTIGNFTPGSRRRFLHRLAALLGAEDHLLLGTDLVKDVDTLEAAYDDSAGVTAEFNRNVLRVVNRELGADFPLELFDHVAFFDPDREWIEMRLRARRACRVRVEALDLEISFRRGEELRTEISAKFTRERLEADYGAAGMALARWYTDPRALFALSLAQRLPGSPSTAISNRAS